MKQSKVSGDKDDTKLAVKKTTSNWKYKRPPSPFFVFMEEFKEQFQEANPNNKSIAAIGKAGGVKWKAMSDFEKASYVAEADKRKIEYGNNMAAYNKKRTTYQRLPIKKYEEDESTHPPIGMDLWNLTNRGKTNGIKCESHNHLDPDFVMTGSLSVSSPSTDHSSTVARHDEHQTMKGGKSSGAQKKADTKLAVKNTTTKGKAAKDPNKPKRPASAFFVFMEDFRKQYKEENPNNKSVAAVGKAGGVKWKAMSDSDKAPYVAKADKRKAEYEKTLAAYNKKQASGGKDEDDDSDKSKSEINNEDEDEDSDDGEEEDD